MRAHLIQMAAAIAVLATAAGTPASNVWAQEAHYPAGAPKLPIWSDLPDWNGLWERGGDIVWDDSVPHEPGKPQVPPYNDEYMKSYLARRAELDKANAQGRPRNMQGGELYASMPAIMIGLYPLDIQINPHEVIIMTANGGAREIYTDGRSHPVTPLPSQKGHSIGHWEGKVLVVDTCCIKTTTRLPGGGAHSDAMRITERIWAPDDRSLKDAISVEDSNAFTKPWTTEKLYYRRPTWETVEYDPGENHRDFNSPPVSEQEIKQAMEAPAAAPVSASPTKPDVIGVPATVETLQKSTSRAVGNLAWETVNIQDVKRTEDTVRWVGVTRSARWGCTARSDGERAHCER